MASKGISAKNDSMDVTVTPLGSTRGAPYLIQEGDEATNGGSGLAQKLRFSKTVLGSDSEGRSVRADSNKSTSSQQYAKGDWNVGFGGTCSVTNVMILACCPCVPAGKIHGMLGASFETGVLYFGGLVFSMLITLGLSFSNTSTVDSSSTRSASSSSGYVRDDFVAAEADPSTVDPVVPATTSSNSVLYGGLIIAMLALFLLGVAFLRTKARHRFNIPGNRAVDCMQSFACCWCVLSQTQSHIDKNNRYEFGLDTPPDTLPAFS